MSSVGQLTPSPYFGWLVEQIGRVHSVARMYRLRLRDKRADPASSALARGRHKSGCDIPRRQGAELHREHRHFVEQEAEAVQTASRLFDHPELGVS